MNLSNIGVVLCLAAGVTSSLRMPAAIARSLGRQSRSIQHASVAVRAKAGGTWQWLAVLYRCTRWQSSCHQLQRELLLQPRRWPQTRVQGKRMRPNPSLEPTRTGMALGPRARGSYHRPRGPSAIPALAPQLKR